MVKWRGAGSPVSGSAPVVPAVFLNDTFPMTEYWGATKEVAAAPANSFQVERVSNGALTDIPWAADNKNANAVALSTAIGGSTGRIAKIYGQKGLCNLVQSSAVNRPPVSVGSDGKVEFGTGTGTGLLAETPAVLRTAKVHIFMASKFGQSSLQIGSRNPQVLAGIQGAGVWWSVARYGMRISDTGFAELQMPQNGQSSGFESQLAQGAYSQAHMGKWSVWAWSNNTRETRVDKDQMLGASASVDITYGGSENFLVGTDLNGTWPILGGPWRGMAFYDNTQSNANWNAIVDHYINNTGIGVALNPLSVSTPNASGFTWTPVYIPGYGTLTANDANGMAWNDHHGGYPWSCWEANNVNNGVAYMRFENRKWDDDVIINHSNRTEQSGYLNGNTTTTGIILPGDSAELFFQFLIEPGPNQNTNDWCDIFQVHYDDGGSTTTPDLYLVDIKNDLIQPSTQRNQADGSRTARGSSIALVRGVWYAMRVALFWSVGRTTDTLQVFMGPNGATLPQTANIAASPIFDTTAANAYCKRGIYRGFPANVNGDIAMQIANYRFSKTPGAFAALVTTQPALPTHP